MKFLTERQSYAILIIMSVEVGQRMSDEDSEWLPPKLEDIVMEVLGNMVLSGKLVPAAVAPSNTAKEKLLKRVLEEPPVNLYLND